MSSHATEIADAEFALNRLSLEADRERYLGLRRLQANMMADDLRKAAEAKIDQHFQHGRFARLLARFNA
jgi:hypothetical protein